MAIVFQNNKYNITIDSKTIIGLMGKNLEKFIVSLTGDDVFYLDNNYSVSNKKVFSLLDIDNNNVIEFIKEFDLNGEFLNKKINELSHSEQKLFKYLLLILSNKNIIIINEPFLDLDANNYKKIVLLMNKLIKEKKTIIVSSVDSNTIYPICKRVLFIKDSEYYYGDISSFTNQKLLKKYHVNMPDLVKFTMLAKNKNIKLICSQDIRDLIKDVYRNVSQKQN